MKSDSTHEQYFEWWAEEAIQHGAILRIERGEKIELTPKQSVNVGNKTKFLLHPHTYEWDYTIYWNGVSRLHDSFRNTTHANSSFFNSSATDNSIASRIDIKPDRVGKSTQYTAISFPINQKLVYDKFGYYIQKVVLYPATNTKGMNRTLFTETWTPEKMIEHSDWRYKRDSKHGLKGQSRIKWPVKTSEIYFANLFEIEG